MRSKVFQKCSWGQNSHFYKIKSISHLKIVFISWTILQLQVRSQDRNYSYIYKVVTDTTFYIYNIVQDIESLNKPFFFKLSISWTIFEWQPYSQDWNYIFQLEYFGSCEKWKFWPHELFWNTFNLLKSWFFISWN